MLLRFDHGVCHYDCKVRVDASSQKVIRSLREEQTQWRVGDEVYKELGKMLGEVVDGKIRATRGRSGGCSRNYCRKCQLAPTLARFSQGPQVAGD
jgi:hypothetical protein